MPRLPWDENELDNLGASDWLTSATQMIYDTLSPFAPKSEQLPQSTSEQTPQPKLPSFSLSDWTPWAPRESTAQSAPASSQGMSFNVSDWSPWAPRPFDQPSPSTATETTAGPAAPAGPAARTGAPTAPGEIEQYIRYAAGVRKIDPDVAVRVARSEGLDAREDPVRQSDVVTGGRRETSYGPFQLYVGGGLGDAAIKAGIDPRDPAQWRQAVDFALDQAAAGGWGPWHGAARVGVGNRQGIGTYEGPPPPAPPSTTQRASESRGVSGERAAGLDVQGITQAYRGVPYTFGGPGGRQRDSGVGAPTDCSGFVSAVWKEQYGLTLPAHTDAAYRALQQQGAPEVSTADARPGDVVFYMGAGSGGAITHHMGVYAGNGKVLDMSVSGGGGVHLRDVGHAGRFVILRDTRINQSAPKSAEAPPPIVPTGLAEASGGQKPSQQEINVASAGATGSSALDEARAAASGEPMMMRNPWELPTVGTQGPPVRDDYAQPAPAAPFLPGDGGTAPTPPPYDPRDADQGPRELDRPAQYDPRLRDEGPREALPGSVGATPYLGPISTQPEPVTPPSPAPHPSVAPPAGFITPPGSPYADQRADQAPRPGVTGDVQAFAGEPDYAPRVPPGGAVFGPGGLLEPAGGMPRIMERMEQIEENAARMRGGRRQPLVGWRAAQDPEFRAQAPEMAAEYDDLQRQLDLTLLGQVGDTPRILGRAGRLLAEAGPPGAVASATQTVPPYRIGGMSDELQAGVIPPNIVDQLDIPIAVPDDPWVLNAVKAAGGSVDERGITLNVIRNQSPQGAGGAATRGMPFYIAGPPGSKNPEYATVGDTPIQPGGTQRIEGWTRFRNPLVLPAEAGSDEGFEAAMQRLGRPDLDASSVDRAIAEAQRAGPNDSLAERHAFRDLVSRFGGDPEVMDTLLAVRGSRATESYWSIKENIVGERARRAGHDAVIVIAEDVPFVSGSRIVEVADVREARNPTPGVRDQSAIDRAQAAIDDLQAGWQGILRRVGDFRADDTLETWTARQAPEIQAEAARVSQRADELRAEIAGVEPGPPGYALRPDIPRQPGVRSSTIVDDPRFVEVDRAYTRAQERSIAAHHARNDASVAYQRNPTAENLAARNQADLDMERAREAFDRAQEAFDEADARGRFITDPTARGVVPLDAGMAGSGALAGGLSAEEDATASERAERVLVGLVAGGLTSPRLLARWKKARARAASQAAAAKAAGNAPPPGVGDWLRSIGYSGMIGPSTGTINAIGNGAELLYHIPKDVGRAILRGKPREALVEARGLAAGFMHAGGEVLDALAGAHPGGGVETARLSQRVSNPIGQLAAQLIEAPTRVFSEVPDAFYRSISEHMGMYREAAQQASKEGLTGQRWSEHVDQLLQDAKQVKAGISASVSDQARAVVEAGDALGQRLTLRGDVGVVGQKTKDLMDVLPLGMGNVLMPFFNTPYQMTQRLAERTPGVGARMTTQPTRYDTVYDQVVGSAIAAGVVGLAAGGLVTGSGPEDSEQRKSFQSRGWQANSTLVGGVWVPNNVFGVFGPLLDTAGEIGDGFRYQKAAGTTRDLGADLVRRAGRVVTNQAYLRGFADVIGAITSPGERLEAYGASLASRTIPLGATARQIATAQDTYERRQEPAREVGSLENIRQRVSRGIPEGIETPLGTRQDLPVEQDILGQPVLNQRQGLASFGPRTRRPTPNPVLEQIEAAGLEISPPRTEVTEDSVKIDLTPAETRRWNELRGAEITTRVQAYIDNGTLDRMTPAQRTRRLEAVLDMASTRATSRLRGEIGSEAMRQRRSAARTGSR